MEMLIPNDSVAFIQIAESVLHGKPFEISIDENVPYYSKIIDHPSNTLGSQLYLTLPLLAPIFWFTSSTIIFLVIQCLVVTLAAIPLYLLAQKMLLNRWLALLISVSYLVNPLTYNSFAKFGFRVENFFVIGFFCMFYWLEKKNYIGAIISLLFVLFTKHNMILFTFGIGCYYLVVERKHIKFALFSIALALIYYVVGVKWIMGSHQLYAEASYRHLTPIGATPTEIVYNVIFHPGMFINAISIEEWRYAFWALFPVGFLALFHPLFWVSGPQLIMLAVLSDLLSIFLAWHWAAVIPFVFIGIIGTLKYLLHFLASHLNKAKFGNQVIFGILIFTCLFNLLKYKHDVIDANKYFYYKKNNIDISQIQSQLSIIDPKASVMASGQLIWFLAAKNRELHVSDFVFHDDVDYIAVLLPIGQLNHGYLDRLLIEELMKHDQSILNRVQFLLSPIHLLIRSVKSIGWKFIRTFTF